MTPAGMYWNGWCPGDMGGTIRFAVEKRRVKSKYEGNNTGTTQYIYMCVCVCVFVAMRSINKKFKIINRNTTQSNPL